MGYPAAILDRIANAICQAMNKTSTSPSVRVDPLLRQAAEDVLAEGESLTSFVEQSIKLNIRKRQLQQEFIKRGLEAEAHANQTGGWHSHEEVMAELDKILEAGRKRRQQ
jgi:predicted transcriptional regulator